MSADVTLTIDGRELTVPSGTLVIRAAERLGIYVPRFCDHPYLEPLGACRQCLVEIEGQRKPLTSCTTPVAAGMVVKTQFTSQIAEDAQRGVLELLLINHPLDCPVCDKGGECPLQDQALAYGPGASRFVEPKRRFVKPVPVSPLVFLDRERCVLCARCTRFANEISGDPFIELFERGALEQVAIFEDEPYNSVFSGNVIQICPVGALTSANFRFRARPFDMTSAPSVCGHCASGCNLTIQERRGDVVRVLARDNPDVNEDWSCDKGRFGHAYVEHPDRVREPLIRKEGVLVAVSWAEAVRTVAERVDTARRTGGIAVLTGDRLPDEDAYALSRFARTVLGTNDVDHRLRPGTTEETAVLSQLASAAPVTYADVEKARLVIVAGLDPREESPILFLRLRKAMRKGVPIVELQPRRTALARSGARSIRCTPGSEADVLLAAASLLGARAQAWMPSEPRPSVTSLLERCGADAEHVRALAGLLQEAGSGTVVLAGERLALSPGALSAAYNLAGRLGARFARVGRKAGAAGALWAGLMPDLLPGGRRVSDQSARVEVEAAWKAAVPATVGRDGRAILEAAAAGILGLLFCPAVDPASDTPDATLGSRALSSPTFVVTSDILMSPTARAADVVLPAAAIPERAGTFTDWEGRAQPFSRAIPAAGLCEPDWSILAMIAAECGFPFPRSTQEIHREMRALARPPASPAVVPTPEGGNATRDEHYGFVLVSYPLLLDAGTMLAGAGALMATAEPAFIELNARDAARIGVAEGDRVRVSSMHGTVEGELRVLRDLPNGTVFVPANQPGASVNALLDGRESFPPVRVDPVDRAEDVR